MDCRDVAWHGYWPAAPTPFDGTGRLDEDALRQLMDLYVGQGMHGILVNGSTGEWFGQTPAQRREVAGIAVTEVAGRCPVVIGVSGYTATEAIGLAQHAAGIGADGAGPHLARTLGGAADRRSGGRDVPRTNRRDRSHQQDLGRAQASVHRGSDRGHPAGRRCRDPADRPPR